MHRHHGVGMYIGDVSVDIREVIARSRSAHMTALKKLKIVLARLIKRTIETRNAGGDGEIIEGHRTGIKYIHHHQDFLRRQINEYVAR